MTVGFFAPLPPAPSGVADYAQRLLRELRMHGDVALAPKSATINLYQLGNNHLHAEIYRRALSDPGVIVLHDAVLHHFALGFHSREQYIEEFVYNYGEWSRSLAAELWARRSRSAADQTYYRYPMLKRIVERSRAVVVHNPAAAGMVREHVPGARVIEIPHLFVPEEAPAAEDMLALRAAMNVRPSQMLCGVFGYLRQSKRIRNAVLACERNRVPIVVAGQLSREFESALSPELECGTVRRVGYAEPDQFRLLAHSVDICINLRYPAAGETSGIGVYFMGIGKPVLLTESEETSRYPNDTCVRIEHGLAERSHLENVIAWLSEFPSHARRIGAQAARHMSAEHSPEHVSELYWQVLRTA